MDYQHIPSDLGTDITLSLEEEALAHTGYKNFDKLPNDFTEKFGITRRWYSAIMKSFQMWNPVAGMRQGAYNVIFKNSYWDVMFKVMTVPTKGQVLEFDPRDIHFERDYVVQPGVFALNKTLLHEYCSECNEGEYVAPKSEVRFIDPLVLR